MGINSRNIAGIVNESGTCFGLMPHPERNFFSYHNPAMPASTEKTHAHFRSGTGLKESKAVGYQIFKNAIDYI
ncbi:MAG: phosphoribosylformylglycinamidine synthase subunit PurQ [Candidatus Omnitrophica bacterium]|nr:phosphoribosylformylglycinamidine synthase subunit PurQ [Candidatus Omnitrophota bacterium]